MPAPSTSRYNGVDLPDIVTLGIRQRITDRLRVMAGAEWANWSRFDTGQGRGRAGADRSALQIRGQLVLLGRRRVRRDRRASVRAGVGYEQSPIGEDNASATACRTTTASCFPRAASYRLNERFSFDLGYSFVAVEDTNILAADAGGPAANGPFSGHADAYAHYLAAAIKVKF